MRFYHPDPDQPGSAHVPTGLETDPNADETVINQQNGEDYPHSVEQTADTGKTAPDNLADSIAYALDGTGPGPTGDTPNVSGHKTVTEGVTGANLDEEEDAMGA
ncbi:hypothetical protein [Spirosoma montaniterrae]|uniref:Uncharacterized protein n=1 Tax=Spirosoma montaniterrae TaxID=1178516 RepID=A0A1P9WWH7_9BACT|nr:hypothetical protein [Spirosoma montaniterrae]AQG79745.1 hypothetical protein AWR27_10650 [Spirosoma montaniterrae]